MIKHLAVVVITVCSIGLFSCWRPSNKDASTHNKRAKLQLVSEARKYFEGRTVHAYAESNSAFHYGSYMPELTRVLECTNGYAVFLFYDGSAGNGFWSARVNLSSDGKVTSVQAQIPVK